MLTINHEAVALAINAPALFADAEFKQWINNGNPKFTWHKSGDPGEYSDVVILIDPSLSGEGSDDDMPGWNAVVDAVRAYVGARKLDGHVVVRLTNLT